MKKCNILLFIFAIFIFTSCSNKTNEKIKFPFEEEIVDINYDNNLKLSTLSNDENKIYDNYNDLAKAIDLNLFNSISDNKTKYFYKLSDGLINDLKTNPIQFLKDAVQIAPMAHNFLYSYDNSRIDENMIGIDCHYTDDYASKSYYKDNVNEVINYEFYMNSLNYDNYKKLNLSDLPIYKKNNGYLKVANSEQLFYALLNDYIPYCDKDSISYEILAKSLDILSKITNEDNDELANYKAIYQYVLQTTIYDDETFNNKEYQNKTNKSFFLEGSFIDGYAVCDGLVKKIIVLSKLMGIEIYHIGAVNNNLGHAYLYVKINGNYYLSCPTYAQNNMYISDDKFQKYFNSLFMLTDADTESPLWSFDSKQEENIKELIASPFDYFKETKIDNDNLMINDINELFKLLENTKKLSTKLNNTIEVEVLLNDSVVNELNELIDDVYPELIKINCGKFNNDNVYVFIFGVEK